MTRESPARRFISALSLCSDLLCRVGLATVQRLELTAEVRGAAETLWKIQAALEEAGIEFIPEDETKGPGVRLKHRTRDKRPKSAKARAR